MILSLLLLVSLSHGSYWGGEVDPAHIPPERKLDPEMDTHFTLERSFPIDTFSTSTNPDKDHLRLHVDLINHVVCFNQDNGRVRIRVQGGAAPYEVHFLGGIRWERSVELDEAIIFSSGSRVRVTVTDADNRSVAQEVNVLTAEPFVSSVSFKGTDLQDWSSYDIYATVRGGIPPYHFLWNNVRGFQSGANVTGALGGAWNLKASDANDCVSHITWYMPDLKSETCPELHHCLGRHHYHNLYFVQCLRKAAAPLLWNTSNWDLCAARAAYEIIRRIHLPYNTLANADGNDFGSGAIALIIGEALHKCEQEKCPNGQSCHLCDFRWDLLEAYLWECPETLAFFRQRNFTAAWYAIMELPQGFTTDVLTHAPFGYENDQVSAPSLSMPSGNISVTMLLLRRKWFPSSVVVRALLPWTLQIDVELGAVFLKYACVILQPRYLFPSDNGGLLIISKLALRVVEQGAGDDVSEARKARLVQCMLNSVSPIAYPPPSLSKLISGHEDYGPVEVIISEDDHRFISIPHNVIADAMKKIGGNSFMKREYSEDSLGVRYVSNLDQAVEAAHSLLARQQGIAMMDLDLPVRIFMQQPVWSRPVGARFYAVRGHMVAVAISQLRSATDKLAYSYITREHKDLEVLTADFVKAVNYTGFGSAWWWHSSGSGWKMLDFNARIERHACLIPVLNLEQMQNDPCYVFQKIVLGEYDIEKEPLRVVAPNVIYIDPIRIAKIKDGKAMAGTFTANRSTWNVCRDDKMLMDHVEFLLYPVVSLVVLRNVTDTAGSLQVRVSGGLPPYTWKWEEGDLETVDWRQLNATMSVDAGIFSLSVTDSRGLTASSSVTVHPDCSGGSVSFLWRPQWPACASEAFEQLEKAATKDGDGLASKLILALQASQGRISVELLEEVASLERLKLDDLDHLIDSPDIVPEGSSAVVWNDEHVLSLAFPPSMRNGSVLAAFLLDRVLLKFGPAPFYLPIDASGRLALKTLRNQASEFLGRRTVIDGKKALAHRAAQRIYSRFASEGEEL